MPEMSLAFLWILITFPLKIHSPPVSALDIIFGQVQIGGLYCTCNFLTVEAALDSPPGLPKFRPAFQDESCWYSVFLLLSTNPIKRRGQQWVDPLCAIILHCCPKTTSASHTVALSDMFFHWSHDEFAQFLAIVIVFSSAVHTPGWLTAVGQWWAVVKHLLP